MKDFHIYLPPGSTILKDGNLYSQNKKFRLRIQTDRTILIQTLGGDGWVPYNNLQGLGKGDRIYFEATKGRLEIFDNKKITTRTNNKTRALSCKLQNDGNLVLSDDNADPIWNSKSGGWAS